MTSCEVWLARDFLRRTGRPIDIPPCDHSPDQCPPIKETDMSATPTLPTHFTTAQQAAALEALGLDCHANVIARVDLEPHQMTVTTHDLDDEGRTHLGPDGDIAKTVTVIPLAY